MMPVLSEPRVEAEPLRDGLVQAAEEAGHDSAGVVVCVPRIFSVAVTCRVALVGVWP
jgi:hypothetical protein